MGYVTVVLVRDRACEQRDDDDGHAEAPQYGRRTLPFPPIGGGVAIRYQAGDRQSEQQDRPDHGVVVDPDDVAREHSRTDEEHRDADSCAVLGDTESFETAVASPEYASEDHGGDACSDAA